ncbi:glycerate kinase type-2 family protein [Lichenibacterium dinghuense]|uniref:glycerate kinase type-2 family protein n=1 Tax=Lichenibacterium dinghuense TaxID=2895977 RepID=UPI001F31861B|nr:glycerate kinase [Lichenibacterium sp. 6Y81]
MKPDLPSAPDRHDGARPEADPTQGGRGFLRILFDTAIAAAHPERCIAPHLPPRPKGRTVVIGAGKAAAAMAAAVEARWTSPLDGLVITRYGHGAPTSSIEVVEAAHPVPDDAGARATARILERVGGLTSDDLVLCLLSGGGSALLAAPAPGLTLADKQAVNHDLLRSGADIAEMNCVRRHLSAVKGGRLARAVAPASLVTLAVSDVPRDDLATIASGPTVPDPTTLADARAVLQKYGISPPPAVAALLASGIAETPKPGDACFDRSRTVLVARPQSALDAAAAVARAAGVTPVLLGDAIEGEAREVARVMAAIARSCRAHGHPQPAPCVLLSGGETTVTVRGTGRGGRNAEFLLALAIALDGLPGVSALAGDTDGIDGSEDNAGAFADADTLARARALGLDARASLAANDGYGFFSALGDLVLTGPTLTNVNDFRAILIAGT